MYICFGETTSPGLSCIFIKLSFVVMRTMMSVKVKYCSSKFFFFPIIFVWLLVATLFCVLFFIFLNISWKVLLIVATWAFYPALTSNSFNKFSPIYLRTVNLFLSDCLSNSLLFCKCALFLYIILAELIILTSYVSFSL